MTASHEDGSSRSLGFCRRRRQLTMLAILAVAAAARLVHLRASPPWYMDECVFVGQSWNLIHGQFVWDAVDHSFLPRLPLFHLIVGFLMLLFGKDIVWVRFTTALCGIATTWLVYRVGRELGGRRSAAIGAALFAICPYAVLLSRWGFTYNLCGLLAAANLYFLLRHRRRPAQARHLWLAAAAAALGLLTEPVMASRLILLSGAAFLTVRPRRAWAATAAALAPAALYGLFLLVFHRKVLFQDVAVILGGRIPEPSDWFTLLTPFLTFLNELGGYGVLGLLGLVFVRRRGALRVLAAALALDLAVSLKLSAVDAGLLYRMGIILVPSLFVGLGFALDEGWRRLSATVRSEASAAAHWLVARRGRPLTPGEWRSARLVGLFVKWIALACLLLLLSAKTMRGVSGHFPNAPRNYLRACLGSIDDAQAAAEWLRPRLAPDDLVITTHMEWMFDCRVASPMLVQLAEGGSGSPVYPAALRERFRYPCRLRDARYAVLHEAIPALNDAYRLEETLRPIYDGWPMVHAEGLVRIYANPARQSP